MSGGIEMAAPLTREQAWELLTEYNQSDALLKHALAVEAVMRHFARLYGEDEEKWGVIGLLHDLDYEQFPEQHCQKTAEIMRERGIDEEYIHAVCSHGYGICCDVEPIHRMEKVLYAIDELTGLINAVCLMRPSRSVLDLEVKSVVKKYKQKNFAAGVDRDVIEKGCQMLGIEMNELIHETIQGMRTAAEAIGLKGAVEMAEQ
jgi:putative nucleotidyltransferase with HDIG domain